MEMLKTRCTATINHDPFTLCPNSWPCQEHIDNGEISARIGEMGFLLTQPRSYIGPMVVFNDGAGGTHVFTLTDDKWVYTHQEGRRDEQPNG